jgi:hypothetical protein
VVGSCEPYNKLSGSKFREVYRLADKLLASQAAVIKSCRCICTRMFSVSTVKSCISLVSVCERGDDKYLFFMLSDLMFQTLNL